MAGEGFRVWGFRGLGFRLELRDLSVQGSGVQ